MIQVYIVWLCFYYDTKKYPDNLKMQNKKCLKNKIFLLCHSTVKWSNPEDFLTAQFVIFRCQKDVKKGYMEMRK